MYTWAVRDTIILFKNINPVSSSFILLYYEYDTHGLDHQHIDNFMLTRAEDCVEPAEGHLKSLKHFYRYISPMQHSLQYLPTFGFHWLLLFMKNDGSRLNLASNLVSHRSKILMGTVMKFPTAPVSKDCMYVKRSVAICLATCNRLSVGLSTIMFSTLASGSMETPSVTATCGC